jgi:hypothetical protein
MNSMKSRSDAFEGKFAHDEELKFRIEARRNRLLGLWAAKLLGLPEAEHDVYARSIIAADLAEPGEEDVFRKLRADFTANGVDIADSTIRTAMDEARLQAFRQLDSSRA